MSSLDQASATEANNTSDFRSVATAAEFSGVGQSSAPFTSSGISSSRLRGSRVSSISQLSETDMPLDQADQSTTQTSVAGSPAAHNAPQAIEQVLQFSPQSYRPYAFGETPFSSPGTEERTFLKPNIFDISGVRLGSTKEQESAASASRTKLLAKPEHPALSENLQRKAAAGRRQTDPYANRGRAVDSLGGISP